MGFADSPATINALTSHGIRVTGWTWRWGLGLKGGTFPPHYAMNGEHAATADSFEALPGEDVNGSACMCRLVPVYRTPDGRFAKPGLTPVFQPPVVASLPAALGWAPTVEVIEREPIDFAPLIAALSDRAPTYVNVTVPDGAIVVHVPDVTVNVPTTPVNVTTPDVTVNVPETRVTVDAPVTVSPAVVNVKPTPVQVTNKIMPESTLRRVFRKIVRDNNGTIIGVEDEVQT